MGKITVTGCWFELILEKNIHDDIGVARDNIFLNMNV